MSQKFSIWSYNNPNGHKKYIYFPLQGPPKFIQIGIFWCENKPSGNPDVSLGNDLTEHKSILESIFTEKCIKLKSQFLEPILRLWYLQL
jgi:hypothetical protein